MRRTQSRRKSNGQRTPARTARQPVGLPARVELHIEELVLHGFSGNDRFSIGDAAQQELEVLLSKQAFPGIGQGPIFLDQVNAGAFNVTPGARASAIGRDVARAIHRGLSYQPA